MPWNEFWQKLLDRDSALEDPKTLLSIKSGQLGLLLHQAYQAGVKEERKKYRLDQMVERHPTK
jgi:hypothetical protein